MPIDHAISVIAMTAPVASSLPRTAAMVIAGLVLVGVTAIATRRHWLPRPRSARRLDAGRDRATESDGDRHLRLALWASGEHFWDYDLARRRLHRMLVDEQNAQAPEIKVLTIAGEVPPIHEQDMPEVMRRLRAHLQGETPLFTSEHRMDVAGDGNWAWVRARGRVVERDANGRPLRIAGTARDITVSRNAEHGQRIGSEVMRSMSEAVAVLDASHCFIAVNQAFSRMTGYAEHEVLGQPVGLLDSSQHDEDFNQAIMAKLRREGRWSGETWKRRKDGEEVLCRQESNVVPDDGGRRLYVLVLNDITEQKRAEQELRYLANYDTLTSLPNRSLLSERLSRAIVRARREQGRVAVLFIDLDRFKDVNDSLGHATGDRLLRAAATRVQETVGPQHTVARLSGDEFTVVLEDIASAGEAAAVAARIVEAFLAPLSFGDRLELSISPSIGISLYPDHAQVPTDLLKHADTAMYQAKAAGRHTYRVYSESMDEKVRHRAVLASALRRALERKELSLAFQPRLSLTSHRITGAEALLRWKSQEFGEVSPGQFIPLAEESGLIQELGAWALHEACATLRGWHAEVGRDDLTIAVNVSALQLQRGDLAEVVARTLAATGIPAACLELELTESVIMANPEQNADTLRACRRLGVLLAIDDFGTGYSSLAYLKRLPLTTLKIDQEFVGDLTHDSDDEAITSTIISMAHSLSLNVIAEGVETASQLQFLRDHGCDEIQGHWIAHALGPDECLAFIRSYGHGPGPGIRAAS